MSHRIIEKRRRDRMNNCLADLSRLVPTNYLKKGRGRIEKTEIIEMAIKHLKHLQAHPCKDPATCEVAKTTEQDHKRQYRLGFQECMSETIRFLVEIEGLYAGDGLCLRLVNHLQKHYDKVTGGNCYTQALGMMSSEDSKMIPMDMEHTPSCFPVDSYPETPTPAEAAQVHHPLDSRPTEGIPAPDLPKQEEGAVHPVNSSLPELSEFVSGNGTQVKVTSQLREMLQNPGLPKEHVRNNVGMMPSSKQLVPSVNGNGSLMSDSHISIHVPKCEEVYKFKNNIKHRFNADLRHLTASPTDSHSDQVSLPDEEKHLEQRSGQQFNCSTGHLTSSLLCSEGQSNNHGHQPPFSSFSSAPLSTSELCVKIPERTVTESGAASTGNWDCHGESGSSCGSNPSPPPIGRSNGSSSGYSTNGEMPPGSKLKTQHNERHSPALSPYSRTPDRLSNCSPSPQPVQQTTSGVPIFALHPKGTFYIPLTIDSSFVAPYLAGLDEVTPVLHPVSICVNFSLCHPMKMEKLNGTALQFRSHSFFIDRCNDQYMYGDRHHFYPCSPVQNTSN